MRYVIRRYVPCESGHKLETLGFDGIWHKRTAYAAEATTLVQAQQMAEKYKGVISMEFDVWIEGPQGARHKIKKLKSNSPQIVSGDYLSIEQLNSVNTHTRGKK